MTVQNNSIGFYGDSLPIFVDNSNDFKGTGLRFYRFEHFYVLMNNSGVTINSALVTILIQKLRTLDALSVVADLRPTDYRTLGNYASGANFSLTYNQNVTFWENAKRIHSILKEKICNKSTLAEMLLFGTNFSSSLYYATYFQKMKLLDNRLIDEFISTTGLMKDQTALSISNIGRCPIKETYHSVKIEEMHIVAPLVMNTECMTCIITSNGKMAINMLYRKNTINYSKLLSDMVEQIHELTTSSLT